MNVNEMTLDEVRDELARMDGHKRFDIVTTIDGVDKCHGSTWKRGTIPYINFGPHPHPATLDGAAAALPKCAIGVVVEMHPTWHGGKWCARAARGDGKWWVYTWVIWLDSWGHDELTARYRLALACRLAEKGDKQ